MIDGKAIVNRLEIGEEIKTHFSELADTSLNDLVAELRAAVKQDAPPSSRLIAVNELVAKREAQANISKVSSFPVHVQFAVTDVCNARCTFCAYTPERVTAQNISIDKIKQSNWLKFSRLLSLTAGLGDSFAHPGIDDILEYLKASFPYLQVNTITNASLLNERSINSIAGYLLNMNVSLNAARKETYEEIMAPLKWDKTYSNLVRLKQVKAALATEFPKLTASYVLSLQNLEELPELPALCDELGINALRLNYMLPPPQNGSRELMTEEDSIFNEPEKADRYIDKFREEIERCGVTLVRDLPKISKKASASAPIATYTEDDEPEFDDEEQIAPPVDSSQTSKTTRAEISSEFVLQVRRGQKPWCDKPWKSLGVDLSSRNNVCCSFFQKFPDFDWKDAAHFHEGYWNHPALQHMRATLNTRDEVPFCSFCKTKDKRDGRNAEERAQVAQASRAIIGRVLDEHAGIKANPELDRHDPQVHRIDLSAIAEHRRNMLRTKGLVNHDRLLVLGLAGLPNIPFLAESNREVVVADESASAAKNVAEFVEQYSCDNLSSVKLESVYELNELKGEFDFVLLSPGVLFASDRTDLFDSISRKLSQTGSVMIMGAMSYGALLQRYISLKPTQRRPEQSLDWLAKNHRSMSLAERRIHAEKLIPEALQRGPKADEPCNFLSMKSLLRTANRWPLDLDRKNFPLVNRVGGGKARIGDLEKNIDRVGILVSEQSFQDRLADDFSSVCEGIENNIVLSLNRVEDKKSATG